MTEMTVLLGLKKWNIGIFFFIISQLREEKQKMANSIISCCLFKPLPHSLLFSSVYADD